MAKLKIMGARLSFASLYQAVEKFGGEPKFSAVFLVDKTTDEGKQALADFKDICRQIEKEHFKGKELPLDKLPIKPGDDDDGNPKYDGWGGMLAISAANKKRPVIVGRKRQPVADGDADAPYSGCYVNCIVDLWPLTGQYGPRIVASLEAIQMAKDGEPFVASTVNVETDFDDVEEESSADIF